MNQKLVKNQANKVMVLADGITRLLQNQNSSPEWCQVYLDVSRMLQKALARQMFEFRLRRLEINEILPLLAPGKSPISIFGHRVRISSSRLLTFRYSGLKCHHCGIEGSFFALELHHGSSNTHLNLYAVDQEGNEVLMSSDHIIPESKGGSNHVKNRQTLCTRCNQKKGATLPEQLTAQPLV